MLDFGRADHELIFGKTVLFVFESYIPRALAIVHDFITGMRMFKPTVIFFIIMLYAK